MWCISSVQYLEINGAFLPDGGLGKQFADFLAKVGVEVSILFVLVPAVLLEPCVMDRTFPIKYPEVATPCRANERDGATPDKLLGVNFDLNPGASAEVRKLENAFNFFPANEEMFVEI